MRSKEPFRDDAEDMAREFKRLANERAAEYDADDEPEEEA